MGIRVGPVSLGEEKVPLSVALAELGRNVRDGYVLFGIEIYSERGVEPSVRLHIEDDTTLRAALQAIVRQLPGYRFEVVANRLVNLYEESWRDDSRNVLNIRVPQFDVVGEPAAALITWPQRYIAELRDHISPKVEGQQRIFIFMGPMGYGPRLSLHLRDITIRHILNAVAQASEESGTAETPLGWVYTFEPKEGLAASGVHSWKALNTVPAKWLDQLRKKRNALPQ